MRVPSEVAKGARYFDSLVPWQTPPKQSEYERALLDAVGRVVDEGDTVIVVGGGYRVSGVVAARNAAPTGKVHIFEGSGERVEIIERVCRLNDVEDVCDVCHGIVGTAIDVKGGDLSNRTIEPNSMPECNVGSYTALEGRSVIKASQGST